MVNKMTKKIAKRKISVTLEMKTVSLLLARLSKERKNFPNKSKIIEHAVNEYLTSLNLTNESDNSINVTKGDTK